MATGSHAIEQRGDKVVVRDVAVFCGFHPGFDQPGSSAAAYDRAKVEAIVDRTNKFVEIGQFPRLVERHKREGDTVDPAAYGSFGRVRLDERDGVPYIVADLEMPRSEFASRIGSGRFPRLSAEIWKDGHLSEVAMLGRETPARPLPDFRFTKIGDRDIFEMPETGTFPGGGNTAVPELDPKNKKKDDDMEDTDLKNECARLRAENDQLRASKDTFEKGAADLREEFSRQIKDANDRIAAAEGEAKRERFSRLLDSMQSEGFRVRPVRDEMLRDLCAAADPASREAFFRKVVAKDAVNAPLDTTGAVAGKELFSADHMAAAVRQANGDMKVYEGILSGRIPLDAR